MSYYVVKVKVNQEDAKGRIKKLTEQYMVHAVSVTDAEALKLEDGKLIEVCSINKELSPYCHIKRGLTKSLNKIENDNSGEKEVSNS